MLWALLHLLWFTLLVMSHIEHVVGYFVAHIAVLVDHAMGIALLAEAYIAGYVAHMEHVVCYFVAHIAVHAVGIAQLAKAYVAGHVGNVEHLEGYFVAGIAVPVDHAVDRLC